MADFLTWVGAASPWLWLALGIVLVALEILAPSFVLIWPGLAAMAMAGLTWLLPGLSGAALVAIFAALSIVFLFGGRMLMARVDQAEPQSLLNARGQNMVGRDAKVLSVTGPQGKVEIDGVQWPVTWEGDVAPVAGGWARITHASGVSLRAKIKTQFE